MNNYTNAIPLKPYEGSEPYIFISYSHRDGEKVIPLLAELQKEGFRFWFDEGIDPGSEWPESIGAHLADAAVCLVFISKNSIHSNNVRREINFAVSRELDFLTVFLEECEMSLGMELQIASFQSLYEYKYKDDARFMEKLVSIDMLSRCREESLRTYAEPVSGVAEAESPEVKKEQPGKKRKSSKPKERKKNEKSRKRKAGIAVFAAAAVAVVLILILRSYGGKSGIEIDGKNFYSANIANVSLSAEDMKKLRAFKKSNYLVFKSCTFENGALSAIPLKEIRQLEMTDCEGVDTLAFLTEYSELSYLKIENCGITDEMIPSEISSDGLETLNLSDNALTAIPEIALDGRVKTLNIGGNAISDISALSGQESLRSLTIEGNGISDISVIGGLEKLTALYAAENEITGTDALEKLIYLTELDLRWNQITDWTGLENMTLLTVLKIGGNPDSGGISSVTDSASTLETIDVSGLGNGEELLSVLEACVSTTALSADNCGLTDENTAFLLKMPLLKRLSLGSNNLTNCENFRKLTYLEYLNLSGNQLTDLSGLPESEEDETQLILLLHDNELESLSGLSESWFYKILTIYNNPLEDFSVLYNLEGSYIITSLYTNMDIERMHDASFSHYYFCDVPLKRKAELEQTISSYTSFDPEDDAFLWDLIGT